MLSKKHISEIKEYLEHSQNPLFLFDNDQDGLCSFLILQRYIGRGRGYPVKLTPLNKNYMMRIEEFSPDCLFILDVAAVSEEFFEEIKKKNIPIVWIDHHESRKEKIPEFVKYFNPTSGKNKPSATTYLCYEISRKKEDIWIATAGCISDNFVPDFYKEFKREYPDLAPDSASAFEIFYGGGIGKLAQIIGSGLKDRTTNVIKMIKFLMKTKTPYDVLEEHPENREMHEKFKQINKKLNKFLEKAKKQIVPSDKLILFEYGGDTSMSSEISNRLKYFYPDKIIFVAYLSDFFVNISARGKNVKEILEKAIKNLENATGGGHKEAAGARIMKRDFEAFKKRVRESEK